MNTLDDLRSTLRTHADDPERAGVLDHGTRAGRLQGRVRAARRRRAATVVAAAAVAVVAAAGVPALLPDLRPGPAAVPDRLAGHPVPPTLESAGWTYEYAGSETGDREVEVDVDGEGAPRLLAWAGRGPGAGWEVTLPDGTAYAPGTADFSQFWRTTDGLDGTFRLSGPGEGAVAVYELADERPPGVTVEGMTFRERVAGDRLLAADAVRGESSLALPLTMPTGSLRFGAFCAGPVGAQEVEIEVALDGEVVSSGGACDDEAPFDPGALWFATLGDGLETDAGPIRPGDVVDVEVRVRAADGAPLDVADDALLGVSFYEVAEPSGEEVAGQPVPVEVEHEGVTWELARTETYAPGARADRGAPAEERSLAWVYVSGIPEDAVAEVGVDGRTTSQMQGEGSGSLGGLVVPAGSRLNVRMAGAGPGSRHTWGAAVYTRVD